MNMEVTLITQALGHKAGKTLTVTTRIAQDLIDSGRAILSGGYNYNNRMIKKVHYTGHSINRRTQKWQRTDQDYT